MTNADVVNNVIPNIDVALPIYLRIRNYMQSKGYVFKVVANNSGIHPKRFYKLLDGSYALEAEELEAICRSGLGVNPAIFFDD